MSTTEARRRLVNRLVTAEVIESQAQLRRLLKHAGHDVTQATISRDLDAIGAVKVRDGESLQYRIQDPAEIRRARSALRSAVDEFVESVTVTGPLVVIRVPPSAAHLVAGRVDAAGMRGILGTVAGDDTVFIAVDESIGAAAIAAEIEGA
ncbi:MAG TPA: arginine repressor [Acidimicrobiia bacterium]|nr:arginine repressor [Acidimicrobiia bacterium]